MYKIAKENLTALFQKIAAEQELYLPVKTADKVNFGVWTEDAEVDLDTLKTVKSPKDVFFPQSETLYTCIRDGKKIKVEPEALKEQDFVVFGMKACDVKGVEVLDRVFLVDPLDTFYAARRDHGTIVALACHEPEETCFCKVFVWDAAEPAADVATWMIGDDMYWKALTEKGEALTEAVKDILTEDNAGEETVEKEKEAIRSIVEQLPYSHLSLEGWNGDVLMEKFEDPLWDELYNPVLHAEHVHSYAPHVSAMILKIMIPERTAFRDTAAGIPACTLTSL